MPTALEAKQFKTALMQTLAKEYARPECKKYLQFMEDELQHYMKGVRLQNWRRNCNLADGIFAYHFVTTLIFMGGGGVKV